MEDQALRMCICDTGRALLEDGLVARTWGNVSSRADETHYLITPSGMDYCSITPEDIALCDLTDGKWTGPRRPSGERAVHVLAYSMFEDVNFVIHTHQTYASALGLCGYQPGCFTGEERQQLGGIAAASYGLPGTKTLQSAVRAAMERGARTILMAHHGVLICARSHDEALQRAQLLERLCRRCWQGVLEESAPVMEQKQLDSVLAKVRHAHPPARAARTDALLTMAALNRPIRAQLDDMAQMIGPVIPVTQSAAAGEISAVLDKRCAVLVPGVGAVVCGKDEDDTQALAVLADKAAVCALHTAALGERAQLSRADIALQHLVYQQKYAKQKEAGK